MALVTPFFVSTARADTVSWVDWQSFDTASVYGSALVDGSTIAVTYTGERGFVQVACGTDYWVAGATNPYTGTIVDNPPNLDLDPLLRCDIIALSSATSKTLTFGEPVTNPLFAVVSLNGNGYRFDRDFDILSTGPGYWGNGTLTKQITTYPDGSVTYDLIGTGEPHGVIQFIGTFSTVTWNSLSNEFWNGFSIAVEHLAVNVPPEIEVSARGAAISDGQIAPLDFGEHDVGTSTTMELTIANTGTGPLNVSSVRLSGGESGAFEVGSVVPAIAAGAGTIVLLTYTASTSATSTTTVIIDSDDADEAEFSFPLSGSARIDSDGDGVLDRNDCAPLDPSLSEEEIYHRDADSDGLGDPSHPISACSATPPAGHVANDDDNCPAVANADRADLDGDGLGDACDDDDDGDGAAASEDCDDRDPALSDDRSYYPDTDGDGHGVAPSESFCADAPPTGYVEQMPDNCPDDSNSDQADADGDGIGTACDDDESEEPPPPPPVTEDEGGCACTATESRSGSAMIWMVLAFAVCRRRGRKPTVW